MKLPSSLSWLVISLSAISPPLAAQAPRLTPVDAGSTAEFRGLHVVDARVIWASGSGGRFTVSSDGGASWRADSVPGAASMFFIDVHAVGADTAVLAGTDFNGGEARIYRTTDGGRSWQQVFLLRHESVFLDGVAFWDARRGLAFGDPVEGSFFVLRTEDGGRSWQRVPGDVLPPPLAGEAAFAASGTALVLQPGGAGWFATGRGNAARVYRTADYGRSWQVSDTPLPGGASAGLFGLAFGDPQHGLAVGGDYREPTRAGINVLRTEDGGASWQEFGSTDPAGVKYGIALHGERVIATAPAGSSWSGDGGRSWQPLTSTSYNTVAFAPDGSAWLAGVNGALARVTFR